MGGRGEGVPRFTRPGWELGAPSTFTIVLPRRAIFGNGLRFQSTLADDVPRNQSPALHFQAFASPLKSCPFKATGFFRILFIRPAFSSPVHSAARDLPAPWTPS